MGYGIGCINVCAYCSCLYSVLGYSNYFFAFYNLEFGCDWQLFIFVVAEHIPFILHSGFPVHIYPSQVMIFRQLERRYKSKYHIHRTDELISPSYNISTQLKRYNFPLCVNMAYCIWQTTNVQVVHLFNGSFKKSKPFFSAVQFCHVLYTIHSKNMYGIQCVHCVFVSVWIERQLTNEICSGRSMLILFQIPMWLLCDSFSHFCTNTHKCTKYTHKRQGRWQKSDKFHMHFAYLLTHSVGPFCFVFFFVFCFGFWIFFLCSLTFGSTIRPWNIMLIRNVSEGVFQVNTKKKKIISLQHK